MAVGMAPKKDYKSRKGKMIPNKDSIPSPASPSADGKLKFSDRLKALLKSGNIRDSEAEPDDPYAFSEPEPQVLQLYESANTNNSIVKQCVALEVKDFSVNTTPIVHNVVSDLEIEGVNMAKLTPELTRTLSNQLNAGTIVLENKVSDDESSKTMNRLQAKIAQNKVIGKHRKTNSSSPNHELTNMTVKKRISSLQNCWQPVKERSLLEEQLLGFSSDNIKKEPVSPPLSTSPKSSRPPINKSHLFNQSHSAVVSIPAKRHRRKELLQRKLNCSLHESLQRIQRTQDAIREYNNDLYPLGVEVTDSEESDEEDLAVFQRHWFSACAELTVLGSSQRDGRLSQVRDELRRKLNQMLGGMPETQSNNLAEAILNAAYTRPGQTAQILQRRNTQTQNNRSKVTMLVKRKCSYQKGESDACTSLALPCTQHCIRHIVYNVDQLLYEHCTAKFSDNTQCCVPVFDICHELPLCPEHARKRDNYDRMCAETRPKKIRKKAKPSAMTRPSKRGKKKKRLQRLSETTVSDELPSQSLQVPDSCDVNGAENPSPAESLDAFVKEEVVENSTTPEPQIIENHEQSGIEVVEEVVFAMAEELPLDPVELANQASRLLEEHDLTNVLNQIPADAFNDLFTEDKNGQYEPTREETEELERALEAVDKDVKSLERLSQTHGLMEPFIDENALVQTLAQLPEMSGSLSMPGIVPVFTTYHNGFVVNSHHSSVATASSTSTADIKNLPQLSSESPGIIAPCISIQTQTDMPS